MLPNHKEIRLLFFEHVVISHFPNPINEKKHEII